LVPSVALRCGVQYAQVEEYIGTHYVSVKIWSLSRVAQTSYFFTYTIEYRTYIVIYLSVCGFRRIYPPRRVSQISVLHVYFCTYDSVRMLRTDTIYILCGR
jgi:hypothetical protein